MQIRWIELNGFKSFPERTKIEIHEGITCFVGPNGAGKSNIVDAFRWILGEHNPRTLRGEKMEEVIFQGSASKREKGIAEVSILLDTQKKSENGNEPEKEQIEIKRRFYRTGESYFIINEKHSRLKDIKEIFVSEGVDIRTYAIIDQIKINELLTRPAQRKALLEECAGISIYKLKKTEAETKLQSSKENLQRLEDIIGEIRKQLSLLERQAKKAEKYKKISGELKNLELRASKKETLCFVDELNNFNAEIESLEMKHAQLKDKIEKIIRSISQQKNQISVMEISIQDVDRQIRQFEVEKAKLEKEIALCSMELQNKREQIVRLTEENSTLSIEIEKIQQQLNDSIALCSEIEGSITVFQKEIIDKEQTILESQKELEKVEIELEKDRKNLFNLSTELVNKKNHYQSIKKSFENAQNRTNILKQKIKETKLKIISFEKELKARNEKIQSLNINFQTETSEMDKLKQEIIGLEKELEEKAQLLIEKKQFEAVINGKIQALESEIWEEDRTCKLFFECIDVTPDMEELIESFFDEKLRAIVVDNIDEIKDTGNKKIFFLKNISQGTVSSNDFMLTERPLKYLKEFVKIKENGISKNFFDNVLIVEDLKEAIQLKKFLPHASFITMNGEVLFADGFIKTGKGESILVKKRMLEELNREKLDIFYQIENIGNDIEKIKIKKQELIKQLENKREKISQIRTEIIHTEARYRNCLNEIESTKKKITYMENEEKALNNEIEQNKELITKTQSEIEYISYSIADVEEKIEKLKNLQAETSNIHNAIKEELSQKRVSMSTIKERLNAKKSEIDRLNEEVKKNSNTKKRNQNEIEQNTKRISQIEVEIKEKSSQIGTVSEQIQRLTEQKATLLTEFNNNKNSLNQLDKDYQKLNQELQSLTTITGEKKAIVGETKLKLENLWNEIYNRYGIDILKEDIEPAEDLQAIKQKITHLALQLKEIGPVDVEILREYEEVKERYDFLIIQQKDIMTSIEELEEAIKKINSLTRKNLRQTFSLLKEKFNSLFSELFGGGKADLVLTDENNILESEIEIQVQLPGKKTNNINLLSGGEKTLTALAFIFACLSIRPSPVCILDEIDSPLDDPNTLRCRNMIKALSNKTQFLVITHNKLMMELADYIYGVTMQEEGVSTVISLGLREAEVYV